MIGFKSILLNSSISLRNFPNRKLIDSSRILSRCLPSLNVMNDGDKFSRSTASKKDKGKATKESKIVNLEYLTYDEIIDEKKGNTPLIIMHGLLGSKHNWNAMARALNKKIGRKIYTVDARNHGESPHTAEFTYELMVSDLLTFMQIHQIPKASLIGHSLGGRVAMMLSLMYPQLIKSLVVVDISPIGASPNLLGIKQLLKDIKNLDLHPYLTLSEARKQAASQLKEKIKDERIIAFLLTNLVENEYNTNWRWKFNLDSLFNNFEKEVVHFPVPSGPYNGRTLFVGGADSDYLKQNDEPKIKKLFPAAEFTYIKGAGHWVHAEKPTEFLTIVSDFINKDTP